MTNISDNILDYPVALKSVYSDNGKKAVRELKTFEQDLFSENGIIHQIIQSYQQKDLLKLIIETNKLEKFSTTFGCTVLEEHLKSIRKIVSYPSKQLQLSTIEKWQDI